jgi:hypothetical protein
MDTKQTCNISALHAQWNEVLGLLFGKDQATIPWEHFDEIWELMLKEVEKEATKVIESFRKRAACAGIDIGEKLSDWPLEFTAFLEKRRGQLAKDQIIEEGLTLNRLRAASNILRFHPFIGNIKTTGTLVNLLNPLTPLNMLLLVSLGSEFTMMNSDMPSFLEYVKPLIVSSVSGKGPRERHKRESEHRNKLLEAFKRDCIRTCQDGFSKGAESLKNKVLNRMDAEGKFIHQELKDAIKKSDASGKNKRAVIDPTRLTAIAKEVLRTSRQA